MNIPSRIKTTFLSASAALGLSACAPEFVECPEGAEAVLEQTRIDLITTLSGKPNKVKREARNSLGENVESTAEEILTAYVNAEIGCVASKSEDVGEHEKHTQANADTRANAIGWSYDNMQNAIQDHREFMELSSNHPGHNIHEFCSSSADSYIRSRAALIGSAAHEAAHLIPEFDYVGNHEEMTTHELIDFHNYGGPAPDSVYAWQHGTSEVFTHYVGEINTSPNCINSGAPDFFYVCQGVSNPIDYTIDEFKMMMIDLHTDYGLTPPAWDDIRVCAELLPQAD